VIHQQVWLKIFFVLLCVVCIAPWSIHAGETATALQFSIIDYENGEYQKAADSLEKLIPTLPRGEDLEKAYKYLAFSYGMLNRIEKAKSVFQQVLGKFPAMTIDTLETPPNIAIIFKQVKLEKKIERISASRPKPVVIIQKKNNTMPAILLSCSIAFAAGGAGLLYYGNQQHVKYLSITDANQPLLDRYYSRYLEATIGGVGSAGVAAVLLPISVYLLTKKEKPSKGPAVSFNPAGPSFVFSF
jgi:tetratricopeptide (TPR) repeat protein